MSIFAISRTSFLTKRIEPVFYIVQSGLQSGLDGLPRSGPVRPFGRTEQK